MIHIENDLTRLLKIRHPLVMAPMFLVSNEKMVQEAMKAGILGCFPSLNYRSNDELEQVIIRHNNFLKSTPGGNYGVNLIVQKSNPFFEKHLEVCVRQKVPVYITSLGNPKSTIQAAHAYGAKVFCDVTNLTHAKKCHDLGCDGFVAVGQGAGGHAGPFPISLLIRTLRKEFPKTPVLAAGGVADGYGMLSVLAAGASAAYCGTMFITSTEAAASREYKEAILQAGMENIVMTERISGTPCTIINTPFAQKIGTRQTWFEKWMSNNPRTKKYFKMLIQKRGFNWLESAMKPGNYNSLWCAGQSVELINDIRPVSEIVHAMITELDQAFRELNQNIRT